MRKYRYLAMAAGVAALLSVPAGAAVAASTHAAKPVLRIGKASGTAVRKGAVLKAGLPKHGKAIFTIGSDSATCTSASITAKVVRNPASAGKATLSVTATTVGKCTITGAPAGFSLHSLTAINLPYAGVVKAAKSPLVTITGSKKSRPVAITAAIYDKGKPFLSCTFDTSALVGHASNKANTFSFSKQKFSLAKGQNSFCAAVGKSATFTATYGPVRDTSVKHSPLVFVG